MGNKQRAWAIAGVMDFKSMAQPHIEEIDDAVKALGDLLCADIFYDSSVERDYPNDHYTKSINDLHEAYEQIKEASEKLTAMLGGE